MRPIGFGVAEAPSSRVTPTMAVVSRKAPVDAAVDRGQDRIADDLWRERHHQRALSSSLVMVANAEPARERAVGEQAGRIVRRFQLRRRPEFMFGRPRQHVGAVGAGHEAGGRGGNRLVLVLLIGGGAHEGDRAGDAVADRMGTDGEPGRRRLLVVDAQVERRDRAGAVERELHRHAAGLVQHRRHHAAVDHAGPGVADECRPVGQAGPGLAGRSAVERQPADIAIGRAAAADGVEQLRRTVAGWREEVRWTWRGSSPRRPGGQRWWPTFRHRHAPDCVSPLPSLMQAAAGRSRIRSSTGQNRCRQPKQAAVFLSLPSWPR